MSFFIYGILMNYIFMKDFSHQEKSKTVRNRFEIKSLKPHPYNV